MSSVWSPLVVKRFENADPKGDEKEYYPPYNKLLNSQFPSDSKFTVAPQSYPTDSRMSIDFYIEYIILEDDLPVFVVEIKAPKRLEVPSARSEADRQMRERLSDLYDICPLTILRGISAFGTKICFYEINKDTREIIPTGIPSSTTHVIDTAPKTWWGNDILDYHSAMLLKGIFDLIKMECENHDQE